MPPNFVLLDVSPPDIARLVAAMVQAREAVEPRSLVASAGADDRGMVGRRRGRCLKPYSVTDATPTKALGMTPIRAPENELAFALSDNHPVTSLHTLIVPRRHAPTYFDLHDPERRAINLLLDHVRFTVLAADKTVEGFNVGMKGPNSHALSCPSHSSASG